MRKLTTLFTEKPSYMKCGNSVIARITGLKESTVASFKRKAEFKEAKRIYLESIKK